MFEGHKRSTGSPKSTSDEARWRVNNSGGILNFLRQNHYNQHAISLEIYECCISVYSFLPFQILIAQ